MWLTILFESQLHYFKGINGPFKRTIMTVQIKPELERRLVAIADERSVSLEDLVEAAVVSYLNSLEKESTDWVNATQTSLAKIWPAEDFDDWIPPNVH